MRKQVLIYLGILVCIYVTSIGLTLLTEPTLFSNVLGLFAVVLYIGSLLPGIVSIILPRARKHKFLLLCLKHRRFLGVAAFLLGLNHGALQFVKQNINLLDPWTYQYYFQGLSIMAIMTALALTSSNESVKALRKRWKKLHRLTYLIVFLLPWHVIDKMSNNWSFITPIAILLSTILFMIFSVRVYKQRWR